MRLTLRTLLSYLDDTLEPTQAKAIGAKVAESEQARELMERIKQVTRRRRLTTPPTSGPGGMDSNTIAEYLDNDVTAEKAAEVEQICLASDVHLAEVAACHQILTLVLGEPALVPPSAKQRMYGLVKGPESIPFRKPAKAAAKADDLDLSSEIDIEQDDTLRLGVPAVSTTANSRKVLLFVGGGVLAACLFAFAVWQLVHPISSHKGDNKEADQLAQANKDGDKKNDPSKDEDKNKNKIEPDKNKKEDIIPPPKEVENPGGIKAFEVPIPKTPDLPYKEASTKQEKVGAYVVPPIKAPTVLMQGKDKGGWSRITAKDPRVFSGRLLLSLPGSKSAVTLDSGVDLTLWGNLVDVTLDPFLSESRAILHSPEPGLDADLTLDRGGIVLRNDKKEGKDAVVRVRFSNPTLTEENYFDIILTTGASIAVERFSYLDRDEPFFEDPKNPLRQGPTAIMKLYQIARTSTVLWAKVPYSLYDMSQTTLQWESRKGGPTFPANAVAPLWLKGPPPLKDKADQIARDKVIDKVIEAHDYLAKLMDRDKQIDVALAETVQYVQQAAQKEIAKDKRPSPGTFFLWHHAILCYEAIDDVGNLFETFSQDDTPMFVRGWCIMSLQQWLAMDRNNDYQLLEVVRKANIKRTPAVKIMELFHKISPEAAAKPATYQNLIEGLNNDLAPIRALSHWHLIDLDRPGFAIPYDVSMPRPLREMAVREWLRRIPPGQMPPRDMPPKKKDKG